MKYLFSTSNLDTKFTVVVNESGIPIVWEAAEKNKYFFYQDGMIGDLARKDYMMNT